MELRLKMLLNLLYAAVAMILLVLAVTLSYALGDEQGAAEEALAFCGVPDPAPEIRVGKATWNANSCGACHNKNMKDAATGPALGGVAGRWADYPREDLYAWIRNSQALIATHHPRAVEVYEANGKAIMSNYTNLTDEEIEGLLAYIEGQWVDY